MAQKAQQVMGPVLFLMVMVWGGARAQSSTCTNAIMGLASCLNYVTGNSSTPTASCCSQLSSVVQSQPRCLCSLLNGNGPNIGVSINQSIAITLPGACNVQTPPISQCNAVANGPASEPTSSAVSPTAVSPTGSTGSPTEPTEETPEAAAPTEPSTPTVPSGSGSGSKTTPSTMPSTNTNASNGSKFGAPAYLLLFVLFIGTRF